MLSNCKDCGVLKQPNNGAMTASDGTIFNSTVRFSCNDDFLLVGSQTAVCDSTGEWSSKAPICEPKGNLMLFCTCISFVWTYFHLKKKLFSQSPEMSYVSL